MHGEVSEVAKHRVTLARKGKVPHTHTYVRTYVRGQVNPHHINCQKHCKINHAFNVNYAVCKELSQPKPMNVLLCACTYAGTGEDHPNSHPIVTITSSHIQWLHRASTSLLCTSSILGRVLQHINLLQLKVGLHWWD